MSNLIIWYIICALIITILTVVSVRFKFSKKTVFIIMACVSFVSEMVKLFTHMEPTYFSNGKLAGYYIAPASLPFHLCSLLIFAFFYLALSNNEAKQKVLVEFIVPAGLIAGLLGVIFATSGTSFTEPSPYQSFIYHSAVSWFALYFIITKQVDLNTKVYIRNMVVLFSLSIIMIWVNGILRVNVLTDDRFVNFMFMAKPPMDGLPLLNLDNGWPMYYMELGFVGIVLMTIVHLPYMIFEHKKVNIVATA